MKTLTLTATSLTGKQWLARLKRGKYQVSPYAEDLILSDEFNKNISKKGTEFNVVVIPQIELGLGKYVTTAQVKEYAENKGWSIPTPEIALLLREALSNEDMEALGLWWVVALHEPIADRDGDPSVLGADRDGGEPWVDAYWVGSGGQWRADSGFAFLVPASSENSEPKSSQTLGSLSVRVAYLEGRVGALYSWAEKLAPPNTDWEEEFDSAFNWIESEKERCEIMYGFTSQKLKDFIRSILASEKVELVKKCIDIYHDNQREWSPEVIEGFRALLVPHSKETEV